MIKVRNTPLQLLSLVVAVLIWQVWATVFEPSWLPPFTEVVGAWWDMLTSGEFKALLSTGRTLLIGLVIVFLLGGVISAALAASTLLEDATRPFINAALATPTIAVIPVFALIWGLDDKTRVATVVSFALFPLIVAWVDAVRETPTELVEMADSFTAGRLRKWRSVIIPSAASMLITGVRIAVMQGIKGVVSAEVVIGVIGVGRLLRENNFELARLYAIICTLLVLSIVVYVALEALERRGVRRTSGE